MKTLTLTVHFLTDHTPGTPEHLHEVLKNYLRAKGITLQDDNSLTI